MTTAIPTAIHIKAKITPWDDTAFVKVFESALDEIHAAGLPDGVKAGYQVQHLLRAAGYEAATVEVIRTVDEALGHEAHWIVRRDG